MAMVVSLLLLGGCREHLVHDLTEREVNRVISALSERGVHAEKVQQTDGRWAAEISHGDMVGALTALDASRVLARREPVVGATTGSSLIPSREEQWFLYESKIAAALESTLLTLPGVLDAHVHLHLPQRDLLLGAKTAEGGSGSVLLVTDDLYLIPEGEVASIVAGGAGVAPERVKVLRSQYEAHKRSTSSGGSNPAPSIYVRGDSDTDVRGNDGSAAGAVRSVVETLSLQGVGMVFVGGTATIVMYALIHRRRKRRIFALEHVAK